METTKRISVEQESAVPEVSSAEEARQPKGVVESEKSPILDLETEFARRWAEVLGKENQPKDIQQGPVSKLVEGQQSGYSEDIFQKTLHFSLPKDQEQAKRAAALEEEIKRARG
uniref:Uncharacterized protein n=1 Tax=candidate division CPR3 bacterium TaxID=2268181 RepID=A0A7V3JAQ0_UNCC3